MLRIKVALISLGCAKNTVDSENMLGILKREHFQVTSEATEADVIIVNTCGFISAAKEESIDTILEMARLKTQGRCKKLVVAGCLVQKYREDLLREIPEIDAVLGTGDIGSVAETVRQSMQGSRVVNVRPPGQEDFTEIIPRFRTTSVPTAYLKIAEGCDHRCSYCTIPEMRGPYRSRPAEALLGEAASLIADGAKELVVVAQDTTLYGLDRYQKKKLPFLLEELAQLEGLQWIRLLYMYPEHINQEMIQVVAEEPRICKYLDIPLQHASNVILRRMNRRCARKRAFKKKKKSIAWVFLKSAFGKAVGSIWICSSSPGLSERETRRGVQHAGKGASQPTIRLRLSVEMKSPV